MFAKRGRRSAEIMRRVTRAIAWLEKQTFADGVSAEAIGYVNLVVVDNIQSVSWRSGAELHFFLLLAVFQKAVRLYPKTILGDVLRQVEEQGFPSEDGSVSDLDSFDADKHAACVCIPSYLDALRSGDVGEGSQVRHFRHACFVWWDSANSDSALAA